MTTKRESAITNVLENIPKEILTNILFGLIKEKRIYSNRRAFAAVLENGRVVTWGKADSGGIFLTMSKRN